MGWELDAGPNMPGGLSAAEPVVRSSYEPLQHPSPLRLYPSPLRRDPRGSSLQVIAADRITMLLGDTRLYTFVNHHLGSDSLAVVGDQAYEEVGGAILDLRGDRQGGRY